MAEIVLKKVEEDLPAEDIVLWKHPWLTIKYFILVTLKGLKWLAIWIYKHIIYFLVPILAIITLFYIPGPHEQIMSQSKAFLLFCSYWIFLGIASSVGLGTGLHTFILYLGPYMAKFTMAANECNAIPTNIPSRWNHDHFEPCMKIAEGAIPDISLFSIFLNVQLEAFLWGLGTAIGELPPYFVARFASQAGKMDEELKELKEGKAEGFIGKCKMFIYKYLLNHSFVVVLLCASIPNPLFDLAGLTCGHFLIPFGVFFGAAFIGKSLIKVNIQAVFVIILFSKHRIEAVLKFVEGIFPALRDSLSTFLEKQKSLLFQGKTSDGPKNLVQELWEYFVIAMIVYFLVSSINSLAQEYYKHLLELKEEEKEKSMKKLN